MHSDTLKDTGKLLFRIYIGVTLMYFHGYGKLTGGIETWTKLGSNMSKLGIDFMPAFWGFMSMFAEFFIPVFIIIGLFFRPASLILAINMLVAMISHLSKLDPWYKVEYPMTLLAISILFLFIGPGNFSFDSYLKRKKRRNR